MSEELKPCPFCGHVGLCFEEGDTHRWMWAACAECSVSVEVRKADYAHPANHPINAECGTQEWNSRITTDHADLTAKLKLAVEALEHYANNAHWDEYEDEFNGESGWYSIFNKTVDFGNKVAEAALKQIGEPAKGRDI